jgi:hypothetical protein
MSSSDKDFTRRSYLESFIGGLTGLLGAGAIHEISAPGSEDYEINRKEELVELEYEDYRHDVLYGTHITGENPEHVSEDLDGVFLEGAPYVSRPKEAMNFLSSHPQYEPIMQEFEENDIPVYLTDIDTVPGVPMIETGMTGPSYILGRKFREEGLTSIGNAESLRENLKNSGKLSGGIWLELPLTNTISSGLTHILEKGEGTAAEFTKLKERLHPQSSFNTLKFRNKGTAQKQQSIIEEEDKEEPYYLSIWGAGHVGFEDELMTSDEERINDLRRTKPVWDTIADDEHLYKSIKFLYLDDEWQVSEVFYESDMEDLV